jgi:UDP-glucuronate 4-epimerase
VAERFLLTGGAGFIGSHLLAALLDRGARVTVVDDFNDYYDPDIKRRNLAEAIGDRVDRVDLVDGDLRGDLWDSLQADDWTAALHIAARAGVRPSFVEPDLYSTTNVDGTLRVLEWCARRRIPMVFASSSSVYGDANEVPYREDCAPDPKSPYAQTKIDAEALLDSWRDRVPSVALRFFTVYGPRQRPDLAIHLFARLIDAGEPIPVFGDGSMARDYTHVRDVVAGALAALDGLLAGTLDHTVYNLGSDRTVRLDDMIRAVEKALGKTAIIDRRPVPRGDVKRTWADLTRSAADLGYAPSLSFEEGLTDFVRWLRR